MLVTADMLQAKIGEAERNPDLDAKGRASLIALYRDALSNLGKIDTHTARADAFAEIRRTAPQETDLVRQRSAALKAADPPSAVVADSASSGVQIERDLKREEADLAAVQALRADIERQLAYQEMKPALVKPTTSPAPRSTPCVTWLITPPNSVAAKHPSSRFRKVSPTFRQV